MCVCMYALIVICKSDNLVLYCMEGEGEECLCHDSLHRDFTSHLMEDTATNLLALCWAEKWEHKEFGHQFQDPLDHKIIVRLGLSLIMIGLHPWRNCFKTKVQTFSSESSNQASVDVMMTQRCSLTTLRLILFDIEGLGSSPNQELILKFFSCAARFMTSSVHGASVIFLILWYR